MDIHHQRFRDEEAKANSTQIGGSHYKQGGLPEHWDLVKQYEWDYFQGQITKYLMRWKTKHQTKEKRLEDLKKAAHFLQKYIEVETARPAPAAEIMRQEMQAAPTRDFRFAKDQFANADFTMEGYRTDGTALYKCTHCRGEIWAATNQAAYRNHTCKAQATQVGPAGC